MTTALVTGATAGIGLEFAIQLAASGHDLVLVARRRERLEDLARTVQDDHGVSVEVLPADLADRAALERVADRLRDPDRPVDLLVNNAGLGLRGRFLASELADLEGALDVMVRAVLVLTHAAAGPMRERGHGAVMNVSSVAGWSTMGGYAAAKSWVTTFSEAVAGELRGSGVLVCALCPGFVRTDFHETAGISMGRLPEAGWLTTHDVVREGLADLRRGRVVSVPSTRYRALRVAMALTPRPVLRRLSATLAARR